jgi:hypothetical protein
LSVNTHWAGIKSGELFLAAVQYGAYLIAQKLAKQTHPDVWIGTLHNAGALVGDRWLGRDQPLLVPFDDAMAAVERCENPHHRSDGSVCGPAGVYAGSVRILTEDEAKSWNPAALPRDPRPNLLQVRPSLMESPAVRVRGLANVVYNIFEISEDDEQDMPEVVAVMASLPNPRRSQRKGKPLVEITGELSDRGKAFRAALTEHVKRHANGWSREDDGFPNYYPYFSH